MKNKMSRIINFLVFTSPILDLIISLFQYKFSKLSILGTAFRGLILLFFVTLALFSKKEKNNKLGKYILILGTYMIIFLINRMIVYPEYFKSEFVGLIKYMFFPLLLSSLILILKDENKNKINNTIYLTAIIYLLLLLVPTITNTNLLSYENSKVGSVGWFYSPNEISSIVSILSPFVIIKTIKEHNLYYKILYIIIACLYIFTICNIGTKTPVFALIIVIVSVLFMLGIRCFENRHNFKKNVMNFSIILLLLCVTFISFVFGAISENIGLQEKIYKNDVMKNETINSNKKDNDVNSGSINNNNNNSNNNSNNNIVGMKSLYDLTLKNNEYSFLYDSFYNNKVFNYTSNKYVNLILSSRDIYAAEKFQNLDNYNTYDYLIGLGKNQRINNQIVDNNIEIDFLDILFNFGIIGFIIYFAGIFYILSKLLKYLFKNFNKVVNSDENCELYLGVVIAFLISTISGHVLGAPSVSFLLAIVIAVLYTNLFETKKSVKQIVTIKSISIMASFIVLFSIISFFVNKVDQNKPTININFTNNYDIDTTEVNQKLITEKTIKSDFATDKVKLYNLTYKNKIIFKYVLIDRTFENGITFKYFTGKNCTFNHIKLNINIKNNFENIFNFKDYEITKDYSYTLGYDKVTLPSFYGEGENNNFVYKIYTYKLLSEMYENDYSLLKEMTNEYNYKNNVATITLGENEMIDELIISSSDNMIDKDTIEEYLDLINKDQSAAWLSFDGAYTKLPYSIEPSTTEGYGRNPGRLAEKHLFTLFRNTENKLLESMLLSSLHILDKYIPTYSNNVWLTEYTSTWLKKDYDTKAHYFDTRHNDTISIYIEEINKYLKNTTLSEWENAYDDFMVQTYKLKNGTNIYSEGRLALDYYSNHTGELKTHSSLNHQLAIINSLYNAYVKTKNKEYKKVADEYLNTIIAIGDKWIKEDKDLWYEIKSDGSFSGTDYKTLTLEDLLYTQDLLIKIYGKNNSQLDKFIYSKMEYLNSIGYNIESSITSKLKEGGYIE